MTNAVTDGIKRRQDGTDECVRDGVFCWLADILADNELPAQDSHIGHFDPEYISFMADVAELLERVNDAANADSEAEMTFIERQIDEKIAWARRQWPLSK